MCLCWRVEASPRSIFSLQYIIHYIKNWVHFGFIFFLQTLLREKGWNKGKEEGKEEGKKERKERKREGGRDTTFSFLFKSIRQYYSSRI